VSSRESVTHTISCVECHASSSSSTDLGWRGYRSDDDVAFYCPRCAEAEFGPKPAPKPQVSWSRRHRDANRGGAATFRVALEAAVPEDVPDAELAAAFDALTDADAAEIEVPPSADPARRRVEFDLEAQNPGHATRLALELADTLTAVTPSIEGGWILASLDESS
jgi:hypothetical protein